MDARIKIQLHPGAKDFLFSHFATVGRVFSDVLGQLDIEYISIALINENGEIFFLSSHPSIDLNLIEKQLWQEDVYKHYFFEQNQIKLWSSVSSSDHPDRLKKYHNRHFTEGISIPIHYERYKVVLSFGFKSASTFTQTLPFHYQKLIPLGLYCLKKISMRVIFPDQKNINATKPKLSLIINQLGTI